MNFLSRLFVKRLCAVFFIFFIWFLFSHPYFIKGLIPFPSKYLVTFFPPWSAYYGMSVKNNAMPDVITQIYPWKRFTIETWKMGQVPLWNPYSFSGTPQLANYQSAVLSPVNLLFFFFSEIDAWSLMILLQPLLAGLFMYMYLRSIKCSLAAGLTGSIAFMFSGFITVWMAYGTLGWAILFLPLLFYGIRQYCKKENWEFGLLISISLMCSFFSGHFQISMYVFGASFFYALYESLAQKKYKTGFLLFFYLCIGLLLSMPQILPSLDAYSSSVRSQLFTMKSSIPWRYLITILAPDFYGNPVTRNDWFGQYAEWASYVGIIPLILAFYAICRNKKKDSFFFVLFAVVSLLLATPTFFNSLLFQLKIPALSTSAANRIIILVSFSLAILSSIGLDQLILDWKEKRKKVIVLFFLFAWASALLWIGSYMAFHFLPPDKLLIAKRNCILPFTLFACLTCLSFIGLIKFSAVRKLIPFLIVGLVAFDMLRYSSKWMPFDPKELIYPKLPLTGFLQKNTGNNRIFGNLSGEFAVSSDLPIIEGYDAVYQKRYGELISSVFDGRQGTPERSVVQFPKYGDHAQDMLDLLGVRYLIHRKSDGRFGWAYPYWEYPQYDKVWSDEQYEVYKNTKALPRAFLVSNYRIAVNDKDILTILYTNGFKKDKEIVLEEKPYIEPGTGKSTLETITYTPTQIVYRIKSQTAKLLFLSDVYDAGWVADIDGVKTSILRADYDFRAVSVPSGEHLVRMNYRPGSFVMGLWLTLIGFVTFIIGTIMNAVNGRKYIGLGPDREGAEQVNDKSRV